MRIEASPLEFAGALAIAGILTLVLDALVLQHLGSRGLWVVLCDSALALLLVLLARSRRGG